VKSSYYKLNNQDGFTLMEVMISVVILSVGLLGVATMQSLGLRFNSDALERTQATIIAYGIAEKMRMDPANSLKLSGSNPYAGTLIKDDTAVCDALSSSPDDALSCWQVMLNNYLPSGSITITAPTVGQRTITVSINWSDNWIEKGATTATNSFQIITFDVDDGV